MLLCLDVGNTQIHGGIYEKETLRFQFRKNTSMGLSSDEIGIFLRSVIRENNIEPQLVNKVSVCSVVPHMDYSLNSACKRYFSENTMFVRPGIKTGLKIKYANPAEVGADRIVNAVAAKALYPEKNILIIDFGTATTIDAISKEGEYLGGAILGGPKLVASALESKTAKLPSVEILKPAKACGTTTVESIQSGLYWSVLGGVKELIYQISQEKFLQDPPMLISTGGVGKLYEDTGFFKLYKPELVLQGLKLIYDKNYPNQSLDLI